LKCASSQLGSPADSPPPQLIEMYFAPITRARSTAAYRLSLLSFASTSRMWQLGQTADTMSRSSEISPAQPLSGAGIGPVVPFWFTFRKQPLAVVQAGRP
jgi:hypothetical protein